MAERKRSRLVEMLVEEGAITETQIARAKGGIHTDCQVQSLISMGYISDLRVLGYAIKNTQIPYVMVLAYDIDPDVLALIPEDYCRMNCVLPIERIGRNLTVAMVDPLDEETIEEMNKMTAMSVKSALCSSRDFIDITRTVWLEKKKDKETASAKSGAKT